MKTKTLLISLLLISSIGLLAQGTWTQKVSYPLAGRQYANGFSIGNRGYYAFGCGDGFSNSVNLVEYNPTTDTWTQKANFPGNPRIMSHVFVIDTIAYFVSGAYWSGASNDYTGYNDVWKYNRYNNSWTQLNNFPGTGRHGGFAYSYNGKGYFGMGIDNSLNFLGDFWEYNPINDSWTQKKSFEGTHRKSGAQFSMERDGYIALGYDQSLTALNDVWKYDASINDWIQMNNFPAAPRCWLSCFATGSYGYIVTGYLLNSSVSTKQFWQYNPGPDTWTALPDFSGVARITGSAFSINGIGYNGLGYASTYLNDFWEYDPSVGIAKNNSDNSMNINIYPDPADEQFNIEIPKLPSENNRLTFVDAIGRVVMELSIDGNPQLLSVDCSSWLNGIYFLKLTTAEGSMVKKIMKK